MKYLTWFFLICQLHCKLNSFQIFHYNIQQHCSSKNYYRKFSCGFLDRMALWISCNSLRLALISSRLTLSSMAALSC